MTSKYTEWEKLKADYLQEVQAALLSVKNPQVDEVLKDIQEHLDTKFSELPEDQRHFESFHHIIGQMGPVSEYVELLGGERTPTSTTKDAKRLPNMAVWLVGAGLILIGLVLWIGFRRNSQDLQGQDQTSQITIPWHHVDKLDFSTRSALSDYEAFYQKNFYQETGYDKASDSDKQKMIAEWIQAINGLDSNKAVIAIGALGEAQVAEAVSILTDIATAEGGNNRLKWVATRGLALQANVNSVSDLIPLVAHKNKNIRTYAKVALTEIAGQFLGDSPEQWHAWWEKSKSNQSIQQKGDNHESETHDPGSDVDPGHGGNVPLR